MQRAQEWLDRSLTLFEDIEVVPIDSAAAIEFDRLRQQRNLRKIGRADLLIASIALSRRATLITRNVRHFRLITALVVQNWAD